MDMNYKAEVPVYKHSEGELDRQLTLLMDDNIYDRLEAVSVDKGLSMNVVARTLLDHALKHCNIEVEQGDACKNCIHYLADDKDNYVCCNNASQFYARFRPKDSWCIRHQRR